MNLRGAAPEGLTDLGPAIWASRIDDGNFTCPTNTCELGSNHLARMFPELASRVSTGFVPAFVIDLQNAVINDLRMDSSADLAKVKDWISLPFSVQGRDHEPRPS